MGKKYCDQKLIPAAKLEPFIVELIKERVLTKSNVKKLLKLVNAELKTFEKEYSTKTGLIDSTLAEKIKRRRKLYNSIETGKISLDDIAPRIKELNDEIELLKTERDMLEERFEQEQQIIISEEQLTPYVEDLHETLMKGSLSERKSFIR